MRAAPSTVKPVTASAVGSTTHRVVPLGDRRPSSGVPAAFAWVLWREEGEGAAVSDRVARDRRRGRVDREQVLTVMADLAPAWRGLLVHEGEASIVFRAPSPPTPNAETVPAFGPSCALLTLGCAALVGRNSLPNGRCP